MEHGGRVASLRGASSLMFAARHQPAQCPPPLSGRRRSSGKPPVGGPHAVGPPHTRTTSQFPPNDVHFYNERPRDTRPYGAAAPRDSARGGTCLPASVASVGALPACLPQGAPTRVVRGAFATQLLAVNTSPPGRDGKEENARAAGSQRSPPTHPPFPGRAKRAASAERPRPFRFVPFGRPPSPFLFLNP